MVVTALYHAESLGTLLKPNIQLAGLRHLSLSIRANSLGILAAVLTLGGGKRSTIADITGVVAIY